MSKIIPEDAPFDVSQYDPPHVILAEKQEQALLLIKPMKLDRRRNAYKQLALHGLGESRSSILFERLQDTPATPLEYARFANPNASRPTKNINSPEYATFCRQILHEVFRREEYSLADTAPHRIKACWRIVREQMRVKNLCRSDEPLFSAMNPPNDSEQNPPDRWTTPTPYIWTDAGGVSRRFMDLLRRVDNLPKDRHCTYPNDNPNKPNALPTAPGLPILPPSPPRSAYVYDELLNQNLYSPEYDPSDDWCLMYYIEGLRIIAEHLGIYNGSMNDSEEGAKGMMGLLNPYLVRLAFPTRTELMAYEYWLLTNTLDKLVETGVRKTMQYLQEHYGFTGVETEGMMRMARQHATRITESDINQERSLAMLRIEDQMNRAREAMDLRGEGNALKQAAMISGLTRTEGDTSMGDFVEIVKRVSAARESKPQIQQNPELKIVGEVS